jgi:hypothetical protein
MTTIRIKKQRTQGGWEAGRSGKGEEREKERYG